MEIKDAQPPGNMQYITEREYVRVQYTFIALEHVVGADLNPNSHTRQI